MRNVTRREFVKGSLAAGLGLGMPAIIKAAPSDQVRLAIIGMGGIDIPGSVGGRGRQLLKSLKKVPGAKVVALCDADEAILKNGVELCAKDGDKVAAYGDIRKVLEAKDIDAIMVAMPDHWHALATVWGCQAGKDVYVEKPISYNIWEGRQIVEAAKKYNRIVQVGTQGRSSVGLAEAFEFLRGGPVGKLRFGHVVIYRGRDGIGKVAGPTPIPAGVNYDLWCGPAPMGPLMRKELHYDWHWVWATGTGEMGNNAVHSIDLCRWAMDLKEQPKQAMLVGGRYGWDDDGETPNTSVALLDYENTPVLVEVRGLASKKHERNQGILIQYEGGYFTGGQPGGTLFDNQRKKIREFTTPKSEVLEVRHLACFIDAVRSRDAKKLRAPALEGHLSASGSHMANVSYRLGKAMAPEAIAEALRANSKLANAFESCREHLKENGVDLGAKPAVLGPWVALDENEKYAGELADKANALGMRQYRAPFTLEKV